MRCFVAVPVAGSLAGWLRAGPMPEPVRPVRRRDLHLTLAFLGEWDAGWVRTVWSEVASAVTPIAAFQAPLGELAPFPRTGGRIWAARVAGSSPLMALHQTVWGVLAGHGVAPPSRGFRPHITVGRAIRALDTGSVATADQWISVSRVACYESPGGGRGYRMVGMQRLAGSYFDDRDHSV